MTSGQDDAFVFELQPSFVPQEPSVLRYSSFFGGDDDVGSAAEEGNRARCLTLVPDSGVFPGQVLFSGQTTTDDFPTVAPENGSVLELKWLPGDTRQGFIAYHAVP
jgi:hypothetical protein